MVKLSIPLTTAWLAAYARALEQAKQGRRARPNGRAGCYLVASASEPGVLYEVRVINPGRLDATCTCEHGRRPGAAGHCWHKAAAIAAELERVSRPAPKPSAAEVSAFMARAFRP
jgi:hypothetical protein